MIENSSILTFAIFGLLILMMAAALFVVILQAARLKELRAENESLRRRFLMQEENASLLSGEQNINFYDKGGRLAFTTRSSNVIYVEAADNYANIHYLNEGKEDTFILHSSLKDMERDYAEYGLLRCQRGYLVNVFNVKLMRKDKTGFQLELNQLSRTIPVSKHYAAALLEHFANRQADVL